MGLPRKQVIQNNKGSESPVSGLEEKLIKNFRGLGFDEVESPHNKMPVMPDDKRIHSQSVLELSTLVARYTAWREYAEDQLIVVTAECNILSEEVNWKRKKAFMFAKGTVTERKAMSEADEHVMKINSDLVIAEAKREMLMSKVESFTNCLTTLSREITLRSTSYPK